MNVVPAFLRPNAKQEPSVPPLPQVPQEKRRQLAMDFMDSHDRTLEECAWLRTENEQMRVEIKAAHERARMLETELNFLRDQHDRLQRHDATICAGVDHLVLIGTKLLAQSRAEAYAPPGSGQEDHSEGGDELAAGVADLAKKLAPEKGDA